MTPAEYEGWYDSARGRWIGMREYSLLAQALDLAQDSLLLDVGCGTGWFTRKFSESGFSVTGIDLKTDALRYARQHSSSVVQYLQADAQSLPFADQSLDAVVSITALEFMENPQQALHEMVRIARHRIVLGLLNRHSLLYLKKMWNKDAGGYQGAHWYSVAEIRTMLASLPVTDICFRSAVFLPSGSPFARMAEPLVPNVLPWGSFLVVTANTSA